MDVIRANAKKKNFCVVLPMRDYKKYEAPANDAEEQFLARCIMLVLGVVFGFAGGMLTAAGFWVGGFGG